MKTDIWTTIGPASLKREVIEDFDRLGVDLFRINLSHAPLDVMQHMIGQIRQWTEKPICLDSEGAQLRNERMCSDSVQFQAGARVRIHFEGVVGDAANISFTPVGIAKSFQVDDRISVDFDHLALRVAEVHADHAVAVVETPGTVGSNKAANVDRDLPMPFMTERDLAAVELGIGLGIRHFALSFAGHAGDVNALRRMAGPDATIISKIESKKGLQNLVSIVKASDAILIDRGDLSRSISIEKIPFLQRRITAVARAHSTPVFVATNLLESMIQKRSPTRAEVNDVISTLQVGANGLVLAAETAIGSHPVGAVEMIRRLIDEFERWTPETNISEILEA